jgi:hypothetical protein
MKILRVVGFALLVITLKFLTPKIYSGFENTLLVFFETAQGILSGAVNPLTAGFVPKIPH